jgi:hypothetical protein
MCQTRCWAVERKDVQQRDSWGGGDRQNGGTCNNETDFEVDGQMQECTEKIKIGW